jgi:hypothetical protein
MPSKTNNTIIFVIVAFLGLVAVVAVGLKLQSQPKTKTILTLQILIFVAYVTALVLTYVYLPNNNSKGGFALRAASGGRNSTNGIGLRNSPSTEWDLPLLRISKEKKCCGGGPLNDESCNNVSFKTSSDGASCSCCDRKQGMIGRPVHFEYTPQSNSKWEDNRCKEVGKGSPCSSGPMMPTSL